MLRHHLKKYRFSQTELLFFKTTNMIKIQSVNEIK